MEWLPQVRVLVTRDVDLYSEPNCDRRNLLRSNADARRVLNDYMDLYDEIISLSVTYKGKDYLLDDVCHMPDSAAVGCEVGFGFYLESTSYHLCNLWKSQ